MKDTEENQESNEVAPQETENQSEQAAPAEDGADAPSSAEDKEEKIAGVFKSEEELDKANKLLEEKVASYKAKQAEMTRLAQETARMEQSNQGQFDEETPDLDPSVVPALDKWYQDRRARELHEQELVKARAFREKHAEELQDPILDGTVLRLLSEARANNSYLDQEEALAQAKKLLDERVKPHVKEAQMQGEKTGADLAQKKAEMGAIGDTSSKQKVNIDELSADEFAKYHNLPRAKS